MEFIKTRQEVDKGPHQDGKKVGRFRWKDISGPDGKPDGKIDDNDKGPIGDPNPRSGIWLQHKPQL